MILSHTHWVFLRICATIKAHALVWRSTIPNSLCSWSSKSNVDSCSAYSLLRPVDGVDGPLIEMLAVQVVSKSICLFRAEIAKMMFIYFRRGACMLSINETLDNPFFQYVRHLLIHVKRGCTTHQCRLGVLKSLGDLNLQYGIICNATRFPMPFQAFWTLYGQGCKSAG